MSCEDCNPVGVSVQEIAVEVAVNNVSVEVEAPRVAVEVKASGPQGPKGKRGTWWWVGTGPPGVISGALDHDLYLDEANGDVYVLVGPPGAEYVDPNLWGE